MGKRLLSEEEKKKLILSAADARKRAYCPYSDFAVGASLLCSDGSVYQGCNIENSSFGATVCAERNAIFKAVSDGKHEFSAIAVVGGKKDKKIEDFIYPCGVCRQVMVEFCKSDFLIIVAKEAENYQEYSLRELVPCQFDGDFLK